MGGLCVKDGGVSLETVAEAAHCWNEPGVISSISEPKTYFF